MLEYTASISSMEPPDFKITGRNFRPGKSNSFSFDPNCRTINPTPAATLANLRHPFRGGEEGGLCSNGFDGFITIVQNFDRGWDTPDR
jgi:hypothetical protein